MESILEITNMALGGDTVRRLSSVLHESQYATQRGLDAALPASLAGLAAHASTEQHAEELLGAFRGGNYPHVEMDEVKRVVEDPAATARLAQSGQGFLSQIFGGQFAAVIEAFAGQAGVSRSSATTLLGLAAPLVLNAVGREALSQNLDARGLSKLLSDQGRHAASMLSAPLSTAVTGGGLDSDAEAVTQRMNRGAAGAGSTRRDTNSDLENRVASDLDRARERVTGYPEELRQRTQTARAHVREQLGKQVNPLWLVVPLLLLAMFGLWLYNRARGPVEPVQPGSYRNAPADQMEPRPGDTPRR